MAKFNLTTFYFILLLIFSLTSKAQDYADSTKVKKDIPTVNLKLRDGTRLRGKIIQNDGKNYLIQTENLGTLNIPAINVLSSEQVSVSSSQADLNGAWFEPLSNTSYLVNQSGYNLKRGDIRYTNTYIVSNSVNFGITDNFSANIGFIPTVPALFNLGAKYSFKTSENVRFALTGTYLFTFSSGFYSSSSLYGIGAISAVGTFGSSTKNITVGATWGVVSGSIFSEKPIFQISGITRVSRRVAITSDNFLTTTQRYSTSYSGGYGGPYYQSSTVLDGAISYGVRLLYPRTQIDLGMFRPLYDFGTVAFPIGIPYFKLTTALNKRK